MSIIVTHDTISQTDDGAGASALDQLSDVQITSVQDGDVLTFSTIDNKWINAPTADPTITLTGDITGTGIGSISTTLATVNSNVGSFGDGTHVSSFTVNGKGLVTAASSTAISFPVTSVNSYTGDVTLAKSDVGLGSVEDTALSTWAGTSNITTVGTVTSGTWNGTAIGLTKGGTGATTANDGLNNLLPTQSSNANKFLQTDGVNTVWATAPVTSVNTYTGAVTITADGILPSQTSNSGKYLTTNGSTVSWATVSGGSAVDIISPFLLMGA